MPQKIRMLLSRSHNLKILAVFMTLCTSNVFAADYDYFGHRTNLAETMLYRGSVSYYDVLQFRYGSRTEEVLEKIRAYRESEYGQSISYWTDYHDRFLHKQIPIQVNSVAMDFFNGLKLNDDSSVQAGFDPQSMKIIISPDIIDNNAAIGRAVLHESNHSIIDKEDLHNRSFFSRGTQRMLYWAEISEDESYVLEPAEFDCRVANLNAYYFYKHNKIIQSPFEAIYALQELGADLPDNMIESALYELDKNGNYKPGTKAITSEDERKGFGDASNIVWLLHSLKDKDYDLCERILFEIIIRAPAVA